MRKLRKMAVACIAMLLATSVAHAQKRVALVVGNSAYQHTQGLENPRNDATDVSVALKHHGFQVIEGFDLDKVALDRKIRDFANALSGAAVAVFFYAGHGLQVNGQNYLVPVDAELATNAALDFETVRLDLVHRTMEREASTSILFIDACRNNPLGRNLARSMGTRSVEIGRGLAQIEAGVGTLVSFSTQPGNVALDGSRRNSPFAGALVKYMSASDDDLSAILIAVRNDVMKETQRKQVPWEHSALTGRFYFTQGLAPAAPPRVPPTSVSSEAAQAWTLVETSSNPAVLEAYAKQFGDTVYGAMARARVEELKKPTVVASAPTTLARPLAGAPEKDKLTLELMRELKRVGCEPGEGPWGEKAQAALERFRSQTGLAIHSDAPSKEALDAIAAHKVRVCPLMCGTGQIEQQGKCVAKARTTSASSCGSLTSGARVFAQEPPRGVGALGHNEKAYVRNSACSPGSILEIIGGTPGVGRKTRCVPC